MTKPTAEGPASPAELAELLVAAGAVRFGHFTLTSGESSDVYIDVKKAWTDPGTLRRLARALAQRVGGADRLAGMELGAVPLVVAVALETGLPYVVLRKEAKQHGTRQAYEGTLVRGERVVLLEDVTTTGGSTARSVGIVREAGALVEEAVTVVDRERGARELLAGLGVRLESLVRLSELKGPRT